MHLPNNTLLQGGKYKIIRFISAGGFGCTYEAIDAINGHRVAIKELFVKDVSDRDENTLTISAFSTNKSALLNKVKRKFLEEAAALRTMSHPNIVKVFDSFEENGTAYYVMDYIDGISLHDMVKRDGKIPEQKAVKYIKQVAKALEYVHGRNRLHLDIKPGNIMVDQNDNAILIDFGVSKQYDEANGESTSTVIGKAPGYSPIEQLGNNIQHFTPATDIYALGATLYKCVTGNTPPDATTVLTDGLPSLPAGLKTTTKKAIKESMKPKLTERPQTIAKFLDCFKPTQPKSQPVPKPNPSPRPAYVKPKKNNISWGWIIGGVIAVVIVFVLINSADNPSTQTFETPATENDRKEVAVSNNGTSNSNYDSFKIGDGSISVLSHLRYMGESDDGGPYFSDGKTYLFVNYAVGQDLNSFHYYSTEEIGNGKPSSDRRITNGFVQSGKTYDGENYYTKAVMDYNSTPSILYTLTLRYPNSEIEKNKKVIANTISGFPNLK